MSSAAPPRCTAFLSLVPLRSLASGMTSSGARAPRIGSPFASSALDTLDSHLLTQSFSLFSFSTDFLAPESDHRDWSHLIGPLAFGLPIHLIPFCQLIHTPLQRPSPTIYALPYSSLPLNWTQRLSSGHVLMVGADFAAQAASLPQAAEAAIETLRLVSAVESPPHASEETRYWQWTGIGRYSAHIGATARLPSMNLSSLSPDLSKVVPYVSTSLTTIASQSRLAVSHASFRTHIRPLAAAGDRGVLTAETLFSRGVDETWANLRLAYTHRLSDREVVAPTSTTALETARDLQNQVQSTAADIVSPSLLRRINGKLITTVQPATKLANRVAPTIFLPPPPPRPLLPWSFPSFLSFGLSHSSPMLSSPNASQPRSFRLTDRSSSWLSGMALGVGFLARPQPNVAVQLECGASEQRLTADGRLWFQSRRIRTEVDARGSSSGEGVESAANGIFVGGSWVTDRRQPQQSHAAFTFGLSYMY